MGACMPHNDFATLFDWLPLGAYRSSLQGRQVRANPALVRINGFESEAEMLAAVDDIGGRWYVQPGRREQFRALKTSPRAARRRIRWRSR
jgi:PAS domain-containing protein